MPNVDGMRGHKLTAVLALTSTGCATLRVQPAPPAEVVSRKPVDYALFTLNDGQKVGLYNPMLNGDSIVGFAQRESVTPRQAQAVATADVKSVALRKTSAGRTILAVTALVIGVAIIAGMASSDPQPQQNDCSTTPPPSAVRQG
jgi:hypothetical protein